MLKRLVHASLKPFGLKATRLSTHRGADLDFDLVRLFGTEPRPTIFDVGANVGELSLRFAKAFPGASVHAFEPVPTTFAELRRNVADAPTVQCHKLALSDCVGSAAMSIEAESGWNRITENPDAKSVNVPMTTVDTFCAGHGIERITLLKTDCEGHDTKVIMGARQMIERGKIDAVYSEICFTRDGRHGDFFAIHDMLAANGFAFYALYDYSGLASINRERDASFANALWIRLPLTRTT